MYIKCSYVAIEQKLIYFAHMAMLLGVLVCCILALFGGKCLAEGHPTRRPLREDGVYTLQLATTDCFLSYNNRVCAENMPVVRSETTLWNKWSLTEDNGFVSLR